MKPPPAGLIRAGLTRLDFHKFQTVPIPNSSCAARRPDRAAGMGCLLTRKQPAAPPLGADTGWGVLSGLETPCGLAGARWTLAQLLSS